MTGVTMTNIKKLREDRGVSQQQVADELGTTQQTVARWEAGKVDPPIAALVRLATFFETTVDDVLGVVTRNPPWSVDELTLALELYFTNPASPPSKGSAEVVGLSAILNQLAAWLGTERAATFRNPNGVYMKMMNFRRFDPQFAAEGKVGLSRGNHLEEVVWKLYGKDRERLSVVAEAIKAAVRLPLDADLDHDNDAEITEAEEGRVLTRLHRVRERSRKLVEQRKAQAMRDGHGIRCEVCDFDYGEKYGERGQGYIEVHHTKPLHTLAVETKTQLEDLALVCADCHRMIHTKRPWLTLDELREIVLKSR
jgi:5-methylcytosine-specific restriction protein A